ncbi:solute carrier family 23 member 1-like [Babylonia areolata]|uniref:solute carrier family 23 member 1-like n=1 Tax=Babylonia areolata TaxID=304850 RepID=UPI003FD3FB08
MEHTTKDECAVTLGNQTCQQDTTKDRKPRPPGEKEGMLYKVHHAPPIHVTLILALQHVLMTVTGSLSMPILLAELLCAEDPGPVRARLCGISLFLSGLATVLQCTVGVRLPIVQGGSHAFLAPIIAVLALDRWRCPQGPQNDPDEAWMTRMREIQGNLILASLAQVVLGCTGLLGFLMRFIGPLTVAPTISLIGLSVTHVVSKYCQVHWGIAFMTVGLVVVFSLLLGPYQQPVPSWSRRQGCHISRFPVLRLFAVILAMAVTWLFCFTLTVTDVLPSNSTSAGYQARTDTRLHVLHEAPWVSFPYPFQFGMPTISAAGFVGMLVATLCSVVESVGDYFAVAYACHAPPPPSSAVNRGVAVEGLASVISGMLGAGHATTSYSEATAVTVITRVGSRRVTQMAGLLLALSGLLSKLGAVISLIPDPVIGGALGVMLSMVTAIGLSTALHANMTAFRNMAIFGLSMMMGIGVPQWVTGHVGAIDTGNAEMDQILVVTLGTPMFVGGFVGCFLDNIIPGTLEERGFLNWREKTTNAESSEGDDIQNTYDLPYVSGLIRNIPLCSYIPVSPSFQERTSGSGVSSRNRKPLNQNGEVGDVQMNGQATELLSISSDVRI